MQEPAAADYAQPSSLQATTGAPTHLDPMSLPRISAASSGAEKASAAQPVRSPDDAARLAAQAGKGAEAPSGSRPAAAAAVAGPAAPGALNPVVNFSYNGLQECQGDAMFCWVPPDQGLAVSTPHVFEANNEKVEAWDHFGNVVLPPTSLQAWFGRPANANIFDPVLVFRGGHFYLVALEFTNPNSIIHLSVSTTDSATGGFCNYALNGTLSATANFADYPKVGVTVGNNPANSRLLIATNQFNSADGYQTNWVQELPKAGLDSCSGFSYNTFFGFSDYDNGVAFTLVPHLDLDVDGDNGWYLTTARFGSGTGVTVWRNRFGVGFERFGPLGQAYSNPPGATQPTTSVLIDTIDDRMQSAQSRYGKTWIAHTSRLGGCGAGLDTAVVHLAQINTPTGATAPSIVTVGGPFVGAGTRDFLVLGACGTHQFNPAGAPDRDGNFLYTYSESGNSEYDSPRFGGYHLERGNIFGGFVGTPNPGNVNTTGRHGDYSAAALDPTDNRFVWVANQTDGAGNIWGTRIGRLNNGAAGSP